ncbi:serine hydrolase domain-containing protein [Neoaquamicrobium sediminum]|uniref:serine hydrolase domain-containing protein n=1 Tax=Neoaquamicrobium sediminum TaxID=1849104 RepID=UPI003BAC4B40
MDTAAIEGRWDPAFDRLAECFADLVAQDGERGAVAVRGPGGMLVDIRGGAIHPGRPGQWARDTLVCCFSVTKGVCSLVAHVLIDRGLLDPDWPVARLWPEFAHAGKEAITVLDVLTHRAGLPAVDGPVARGDLYDAGLMARHLSASAPVVPPRAAPVYHNMTYGHLVGEILCRATGHGSLRDVLRATLTGPLDADFRIGLTPDEQRRCASLEQDDPHSLFALLERQPDTLFARSMAFFAPDKDFNTVRWRAAQIGSGSGHATAAAIATLFGQFVFEGGLLSASRRAALRRQRTASEGDDPVMGIPIRYGEGVELSGPPALDFGPNPDTPGHWGAGGATGFADPQAQIAFGYVTGRMASGFGSSERARRLVAALHMCL